MNVPTCTHWPSHSRVAGVCGRGLSSRRLDPAGRRGPGGRGLVRTAAAHGGPPWLDASCICFRPVTCWVETEQHTACAGVLNDDRANPWELQGFSAPFDGTLLENWAFAAPVDAPFVAAWFAEYDAAVRMGCGEYCTALRARQPPVLPNSLQTDHLPYLTQHAAFHVVRTRMPQCRIRMLPSWDGPFAVHSRLN